MNIKNYPRSNQVLVKNNKTKKEKIACFKNGQLGIYVYSTSGKLQQCFYEPSSFASEYTLVKMDKKPRSLKATNYHDKSVIYNGEFKCLIKKGDEYFINWYREEKGKPMTSRSFSVKHPFESVNDFFIGLYSKLG